MDFDPDDLGDVDDYGDVEDLYPKPVTVPDQEDGVKDQEGGVKDQKDDDQEDEKGGELTYPYEFMPEEGDVMPYREPDGNEEDELQHDDYGGDDGDDGDAFQVERNVMERVSYGNDQSGPAEGQNLRMFYALRNQNRSEEEIFLDHYEKYCYQNDKAFNRTEHPFMRLLANHPHPKFLNIALCVATLTFYNPATRKYEWNATAYKPYSKIHEAHDIYRYILLFNMYALS
jgi:hypothetical protein